MKKAVLPIFLCLLWIFSFGTFAADGKLTATANLSADKKTVEVRVDLQNPGIIATRIFVRYDSAALKLISAENGVVFDKATGVFGKNLTDNPYIILWEDSLRTTNVTTGGTLCTLKFSVIGGNADAKTTVTILTDPGSTFDVNLNDVSINGTSCVVSIPKDAAVPTTKAPTVTVPGMIEPLPDGTTKAVDTTKVPSTTKAATTSNTTAATKATTVPASTAKTTVTDKTTALETVIATSAAVKPDAKPSDTTPAAGTPENESPDTAEVVSASAVEEVFEATLYKGADGMESMQSEHTEEAETKSGPNLRMLWLLLIIPVGVALFFVLKKKK